MVKFSGKDVPDHMVADYHRWQVDRHRSYDKNALRAELQKNGPAAALKLGQQHIALQRLDVATVATALGLRQVEVAPAEEGWLHEIDKSVLRVRVAGELREYETRDPRVPKLLAQNGHNVRVQDGCRFIWFGNFAVAVDRRPVSAVPAPPTPAPGCVCPAAERAFWGCRCSFGGAS